MGEVIISQTAVQPPIASQTLREIDFPGPLEKTLSSFKDSGWNRSFLNRHLGQWEYLRINFLPEIIRRSLSSETKKIEVYVLGASTAEEMARSFYEIITGLRRFGENPDEWVIRVDGFELDRTTTMEGQRRLKGKSPFVYFFRDGYSKESAYKYANRVVNVLRRYSQNVDNIFYLHNINATDFNAFNFLPQPDLVLINQFFYQNERTEELLKVYDSQWSNAWLTFTLEKDDIQALSSIMFHNVRKEVLHAEETVRDPQQYYSAVPPSASNSFRIDLHSNLPLAFAAALNSIHSRDARDSI